jgi:hypothetical protein
MINNQFLNQLDFLDLVASIIIVWDLQIIKKMIIISYL